MLDAASASVDFVRGRSRADLDADLMLRFALIRAVEVIGEAASRLPAEYRAQQPQIPWSVIIGMRNRLIHGYFDVDLDILWETVSRDVPSLIVELAGLINPPEATAP
jgi:uncharacterized protein with HEPN domain